jgi:hypothetical protein
MEYDIFKNARYKKIFNIRIFIDDILRFLNLQELGSQVKVLHIIQKHCKGSIRKEVFKGLKIVTIGNSFRQILLTLIDLTQKS